MIADGELAAAPLVVRTRRSERAYGARTSSGEAGPGRARSAVWVATRPREVVLEMAVYTLGIWTVKTGREEEFVKAWTDLAERTKADFPDETATLLRDGEHRNLFISFGPWDSVEQIDRWRSSDTFQEGVGRLRELLDDFAPHTMERVAGID